MRISNDINANQNLNLDDEAITWNWNPHQVNQTKLKIFNSTSIPFITFSQQNLKRLTNIAKIRQTLEMKTELIDKALVSIMITHWIS